MVGARRCFLASVIQLSYATSTSFVLSQPPLSSNALKLWHLDNPFRLRVRSATYVNVKEADLIYVRVGVFHGTEALCQVRKTRLVSPSNPRWDDELEFDDLFSLDLPRAAKLCASICAVRRAAVAPPQQAGRAGR